MPRWGAVEITYADVAERPFARALLLLGRLQALQEFMQALEHTNSAAARDMRDWYILAIAEAEAEVRLIERES